MTCTLPYFMLKGWWISSKTLYKYFIRCLVSSHNTLYSLFERAHCVTRLNNSCKRDHTYCRSSNREKIKIIHLQLVAPKIEFHPILLQKANWNSVVSLIEPNQRYIPILNKWRDTEQEKRIIFQRGLLDAHLDFALCVEICVKMQVVYKELTCDIGELHEKFTISCS